MCGLAFTRSHKREPAESDADVNPSEVDGTARTGHADTDTHGHHASRRLSRGPTACVQPEKYP